jgi:succinoglycan biosynthesis transport protein ExoP
LEESSVETFGASNTSESLYPGKLREAGDLPQGQIIPGGGDANANKGELLEIFWRGRWIIVAAIIVAIGAAVLYLQSTTPLYTSSSSIYVAQGGPKIMGDGVAELGGNNQDAYYLATQTEVLKSSAILNIAADQLRTREVKTFESSDSPVSVLKTGLSVELGKMNDIITVSFESPSPDDAAQAVNAIVDAYQKYNANSRKSTASEVLKVLDGEFHERETERDQKMQAMLDFRKENSDVQLDATGDTGTRVEAEQLTSINAALTAAQLNEAEAHAAFDLAKEYVADPVKLRQLIAAQSMAANGGSAVAANDPGMLNPRESQLRVEWNELEAQLDDLELKLLPDHPDVKRVQRQIQRVEGELREMGVTPTRVDGSRGMTASEKSFADSYLGASEERWRLAKAKVDSLQDSFGKDYSAQRDRAIASNNKAAEYQLLTQDFTRAEALCNALDSRMKEIHIGEEGDGVTNVSVLEVGRPPIVPSKPQKAKTIGIALLLGLSLGLGLAFLNGWMDQRFRSAEDVGNSLNLPILGAVPQIGGREPINVRGQKAHLMPVSDFAEACRAIRTAIYFGMPDSQAKTLLVTSPLPGDGKSTAASNLAIVMAQAGQKTLVLDADFRRPNQHRIFEQDNTIGSTNVLNGTATLEQTIKHTGIKGVDLLPCGPTPTHPAELLNSQSFADLLAELGKRYDHVVVDSPPVMPVTDARILGAICDATVFVVRAEKSTRKVSVFARDVLQSVGTNILGVMINGLSRGRGYYDAGYYQYGYGGKSGTRHGKSASVDEVAAEESGVESGGDSQPAAVHDDDAS